MTDALRQQVQQALRAQEAHPYCASPIRKARWAFDPDTGSLVPVHLGIPKYLKKTLLKISRGNC